MSSIPESCFACRLLLKADGSTVLAGIELPQQDADEQWSCRIFIGERTDSRIFGVDSLQARSLAVVALTAELRYLQAAMPGEYTYDGDPDLSAGLYWNQQQH